MLDAFFNNLSKVLKAFKAPTGWIILFLGLFGGYFAFRTMHDSESRELQLKEERLNRDLGEKGLNRFQLNLIDAVLKLQNLSSSS